MKLRQKMILKRLEPDIERINQALSGNLATHVGLISQVWDHILISGGKRIRPLLFLLAARMCGCREDHLPEVATIFEYLHAATLLHDDVVDAATVRRGHSSANTIWGNQAVILVGDFLLSKALSIAVATQNIRVMEVLAHTTTFMAEGEVLQLVNTGRLDMTEDGILRRHHPQNRQTHVCRLPDRRPPRRRGSPPGAGHGRVRPQSGHHLPVDR